MQIIDFYKNPNVGLFFYTTNKITIIPTITSNSIKKSIEKELGTKLFECDVYSSSVNNIFLCGNEKILFVPSILSKENINLLEKSGLKVVVLDTKLNALGNNMVVYDDKIIVNPSIEDKVIKQLEELKFKILKAKIAGVGTIGANLVIIGKNALVNPDILTKELNEISEFLEINLVKGTVNYGSKIVKAGFVSNKNGVLVSELMTGPEMMELESVWKNGFKK